MDLDGIMLSEASQAKTNIVWYLVLFVCLFVCLERGEGMGKERERDINV